MIKISSVCCNHNLILSSFMSYHRVCNKCNTRCPTCGGGTVYLSGAPEFTPVFGGVRVARSLAFYGIYRCMSFCPFSFDHCVVCPSSIKGLWLPLWYLQTFQKHFPQVDLFSLFHNGFPTGKHIHNYITVLFQICYHELCCHIFPDESLLIKFYIGSLKLLLSIQSIYLMYISLYKSKSVYINKFIFRGNVSVYIPDDRYLTLVQISSQDVYNYPNQKYV
jgi:hypothetical protein